MQIFVVFTSISQYDEDDDSFRIRTLSAERLNLHQFPYWIIDLFSFIVKSWKRCMNETFLIFSWLCAYMPTYTEISQFIQQFSNEIDYFLCQTVHTQLFNHVRWQCDYMRTEQDRWRKIIAENEDFHFHRIYARTKCWSLCRNANLLLFCHAAHYAQFPHNGRKKNNTKIEQMFYSFVTRKIPTESYEARWTLRSQEDRTRYNACNSSHLTFTTFYYYFTSGIFCWFTLNPLCSHSMYILYVYVARTQNSYTQSIPINV